LGYTSQEVKKGPSPDLIDDLVQILREARADVVYTHNFCDKHTTHLAVAWAVVCALRQLPAVEVPRRVIGCEVWRDLDWLPDSKKIPLNVSVHPELQEELITVFRSQIDAGKRYDLATMGRRRAHATFSESHKSDQASALIYGMDLMPLVLDPDLSVEAFVESLVEAFSADLMSPLTALKLSF
jgi:LmbE family N-acetylglucosaminyl deacetylase